MIEKYKHINVNPWQFNKQYPVGKEFDVKLSDNSVLCKCMRGARTDVIIWWFMPDGQEVGFASNSDSILGWRMSA